MKLIWTIIIIVLMGLCPAFAQDNANHVMLQDIDVHNLTATDMLDTELLTDPNSVLWWIKSHQKHEIRSVNFQDPISGENLPTRNEDTGTPRNCYALMIDDSLSMRPFWSDAMESMQKIRQYIPETEYVGLYAFSEDLKEFHPLVLSESLHDADEIIDSISLIGLDTQLYMALLKVFEELDQCPAVRDHVIMFSDGDAEDMARTMQDALEQAKKQDVTIHSVGFGEAGRMGLSLKMEILRTLSAETRGIYHFFEDQETLEQVFNEELEAHHTMGVSQLVDLSTLQYGQDKVDLIIETIDLQGSEHLFRLAIPIVGTDTWDNFLVSVSANFKGINPWLVLLSPAIIILLFVIIIWLLRRRSLKRKEELLLQKQQEEKQRIDELQAETKKHQAGMQEAIEQVSKKVDEFKPRDHVEEQGRPYGGLVDLSGKVYDLTTYSTRIGRSDKNDVVLMDPHVSSEHAILDFKRGKFIWTDRAPMNPTYINGEAVQGSREIMPDDVVLCGETELRFVLELVEE